MNIHSKTVISNIRKLVLNLRIMKNMKRNMRSNMKKIMKKVRSSKSRLSNSNFLKKISSPKN